MVPPELPGFYYDSEKKKYFKIQKARDLPSQNCKYSADQIAREKKKQKEEKKAYDRLDRRKRETVIRSHTKSFISHASLDREIGHKRGTYHVRKSWPNANVSGFQCQSVVSNPVRYFDHDPLSKTLYTTRGETSIQRRRPDPFITSLDTDGLVDDYHHPRRNTYTFEPWDTLAQLTSPVSSMNYLPGSGALCITTSGGDRSPVVYLTDPDRDDPFLGEMYTPRHCNTIWGSSARPISFSAFPTINSIPAASTEYLAVGLSLTSTPSVGSSFPNATDNSARGASSSLMLFSRTNAGRWETSTPLYLDSDILALDWLSENTVALGCRNGRIHIYDIRARGSSRIIQHPCPISRLRRADDFTRLVCSGIYNTCDLYDMRMGRPRAQPRTYQDGESSKQNPSLPDLGRRNDHLGGKKRKRAFRSSKDTSQIHSTSHEVPSDPLIRFQHNNAEDLELGLDVHAGLGLVAAAQSNANIKISNMWTGELIREFNDEGSAGMGGSLQAKKTNRIRCLKWMNEDDGKAASLWASGDWGIRRIGW